MKSFPSLSKTPQEQYLTKNLDWSFNGEMHYASLVNYQPFLEPPVLKCHWLPNTHQLLQAAVHAENSAITLEISPLALPLTQ